MSWDVLACLGSLSIAVFFARCDNALAFASAVVAPGISLSVSNAWQESAATKVIEIKMNKNE